MSGGEPPSASAGGLVESASPVRVSLRGIAGSPGIAVGRVTVFDRRSVPIPRRTVASAEQTFEIERLVQALTTSRKQLEDARDALAPEAGAEHRLILEAHLLMHRDELLVGEAIAGIRRGMNAEWAVRHAATTIAQRLAQASEAYLSERARDVEEVGEHLLRVLTGVGSDLPRIDAPTILVASDLSPAETARLPRSYVLALVTSLGTATSHTAILARALSIPAVVGVDGVTRAVVPGARVVVDALRGEVVVEPDDLELERAEERARRYRLFTGGLRERAPRATRDGARVEVLANVELEVEVDEAEAQRADGIGLYRTEFLFLDDSPPSEDAQTALYERIALRMAPRPVTLRTFDLGADKVPVGDRLEPLSRGLNPALGLRGLRLSLVRDDLFRTQLRAMLRAAAVAPLRVMFPMVCTLDDLRRARAVVAECRAELLRQGVPHGELAVGAMIEVPSAVAIAHRLARECDFFSIGTNDLAQYALAVDRQNPRVSHLSHPLEPAVLAMLDATLTAARTAGIPVSVCGDLAAHPLAMPVLLGMGFQTLSMPVGDIALAREILARVTSARCEAVAEVVRGCDTAADAVRCVVSELSDELGELWDEQGLVPATAR